MLIKIDLESDLYQKIKKLVEDGKYNDILQFIKIAVSNQIQEENVGAKLENDSEQASIENSNHEIGQRKVEKIPYDWRHLLNNLTLEKSEIIPDYKDKTLIWSFYNRFFPVKIIVTQLGKMMASRSATWIELGEFQDEAFDYAISVSDKLVEYEENYGITRNRKLSTGLPISSWRPKRRKRITKRLREEKFVASKTRFLEQFIGKPKKHENKKTFTGACFALGLIAIKFVKDRCFISLTETGKDLALLKNPILDQEKYEKEEHDRIFSDDETTLIWNQIISNFKVEKEIIQKVIKLLQSKPRKSDELEFILKDESLSIYKFYSDNPNELSQKRKDDILIQTRIATMGRLAELQIVNWEIDQGQSIYSLNEEKLSKLNL